jgi:hypothetical protein
MLEDMFIAAQSTAAPRWLPAWSRPRRSSSPSAASFRPALEAPTETLPDTFPGDGPGILKPPPDHDPFYDMSSSSERGSRGHEHGNPADDSNRH